MTKTKFAIENLREAVQLFSGCRESFNELFTIPELILIYQAYKRSEFDIPPDRWTSEEIELALAGKGTGATSER